MAQETKIEWCDHTWNPVRGCAKVSPGCEHCYAAREAVRFPNIRGIWGSRGTRIVAVPEAWKQPVRWNQWTGSLVCQDCGRSWAGMLRRAFTDEITCTPGCGGRSLVEIRQRAFCASLADVFEDWKGLLHFPDKAEETGISVAWWRSDIGICRAGQVTVGTVRDERPATMDDLRQQLFRLIEDTPHIDWLLLTKRPQNVITMVPEHWRARFPENVWMGTTAEDQQRANERIPELLNIPAKVRFLSCEPLLGPVDLATAGMLWRNLDGSLSPQLSDPKIHWVIAGGESGPQARPMHPDWARSLRDQCAAAGVPFLFKQWGEWLPICENPPDWKPEPDGSDWHIGKPATVLQLNGHQRPDFPAGAMTMIRLGKVKAGRLLDGIEHHAFPSPLQPQPSTLNPQPLP